MKAKYILSMLLLGCWTFAQADGETFQIATLTDLPGGKITYTDNGSYNYTITAVANDGYKFLYWVDEGNQTNTSESLDITWSGSKLRYRAVFAHTATIHHDRGSVTVTPAEAATTTISPTFTLVAASSPEDGDCSLFKGWSNGEEEATLTYNEKTMADVQPIFVKHDLLYQMDENPVPGTIQIEELRCGFRLTAQPNDGYFFEKWEDNSTYPVREIEHAKQKCIASFATAKAKVVKDEVETSYKDFAAAYAEAEGGTIVLLEPDEISSLTVIGNIGIAGEPLTITGDLTIASGAKLTLTGAVMASNLYLSGQKGESSQLVGVDKLTLADDGHAYFDYTLVPNGSVNTSSWYGFAVPFEVNVSGGIYPNGSNTPAVPESDIRLTKFDGNERAATGAGWTKNYLTSGTLEPGQFYMMTLNSNTNTWRFESASNNLSATTELNLTDYTADGVADVNKGWNSLANPMFCYANASTAAATHAYIYNNAENSYQAYPIENYSYVVGSPLFLQVSAAGTLTFAAGDNGENARFAPKYEQQQVAYTVTLTGNNYTDYLYLRASEDATATYERGRDLQKLTSSKVPQLWTTAYGEKLAVEDAPLINNEVVYTLEMNAPKAGVYTLTATGSVDNPLYLVQDGQLIWNLSESSYDIELYKGINYGYTLQSKTKTGAVTDIDMQHYSAQEGALKFIYHNNLYIMRAGALYNAQGVMIK